MAISLEPGDAVAHSFEQLHGVLVNCPADAIDCARISLIVWVHEGAAQCRNATPVSGVKKLFRRSSRAGNPEGMYEYAKVRGTAVDAHLGSGARARVIRTHRLSLPCHVQPSHVRLDHAQLVTQGHWGKATEGQRTHAMALLEAASQRHNHSASALELGRLLRDVEHVPHAAMLWFERAKELGHPRADVEIQRTGGGADEHHRLPDEIEDVRLPDELHVPDEL